MPSSTFTKVHQFSEDLAKKVHNLNADSLKWLLTNTAPTASGTAVKADLTEIAAGNGYSAGGIAATITSCEQTSGTTRLILADAVLTPSGGPVASFRYAVLYNDTPTSPADPVIGWIDYGSSIAPDVGEPFTIDADPTNGVLQIA